MRIVVLGPPGAGKGTQARLLHDALEIPHISTGQLLRDSLNEGKHGEELRNLIDKGELVPDHLMAEIVEERLVLKDCLDGFILDGFPRSLPQGEILDRILGKRDLALDGVVNFETPLKVLMRRLTLRRVCRVCGRNYHLEARPPRIEGLCDDCKERLIQRPDDREETINRRLQVYAETTRPLVNYYLERGVLVNVDASKHIDEVTSDLRDGLEKLHAQALSQGRHQGRMPKSFKASSMFSRISKSSASSV